MAHALNIDTVRVSRATLLAASLAVTGWTAEAALPPKYLSVPDFQQCLSTQSKGSYEAWCLPVKRARTCPAARWGQLVRLKDEGRLERCVAPSR